MFKPRRLPVSGFFQLRFIQQCIAMVKNISHTSMVKETGDFIKKKTGKLRYEKLILSVIQKMLWLLPPHTM